MPSDGVGINYVEFIENAGFALSEDVARQVAAASKSDLIQFRSRYLELFDAFYSSVEGLRPNDLAQPENADIGRVFSCPDAKPGEFRPFIHGIIMDTGRDMLGGNYGYDFDELNIATRMRKLKGMLLYAHSIVVSDSLFYVNQFFDREDDLYFEDSRKYLQNYLTLIAALRPLIENGIIIFYPQYENNRFGWDEFADESFQEWAEQVLEKDDPYVTVVEDSLVVNELLFFANRYDSSLFLPDRRLQRIMDYYAQYGSFPGRKDKRQGERLTSSLASVDLPSLTDLSLQDIISIRRDEETFKSWRDKLSAAVQKIDNLETLDHRVLIKEVQEILREQENEISKEISKSGFWEKLKGPSSKFSLAMIAKVLVTGTLNPAEPAVMGGLSFLYEYIKAGKKRAAAKSLKNHYALLTTQD